MLRHPLQGVLLCGCSRKRANRARRPFRTLAEQLEDRRLLAITHTFEAGVLEVVSDNASDTIEININAAFPVATINNQSTNALVWDIEELRVIGNGGNDTINLQWVSASNYWTGLDDGRVFVDGGAGG